MNIWLIFGSGGKPNYIPSVVVKIFTPRLKNEKKSRKFVSFKLYFILREQDEKIPDFFLTRICHLGIRREKSAIQ